MIGIGATLFRRAVMGGRGFNPASLFANGEEGVWYDPSNLSSMKQNSDGTTAVAVGDPVGYIEDQSGNGNTAIQATSAKRPTLRKSSGLYYLEFDGAQGLATSSTVDFTGTDSMTICAGVTKSTLDTSVISELSVNVTGNSGSFRLAAISTSEGLYRYQSTGDGSVQAANASPFNVGTHVLTGLSDISDPVVTLRVDGTQEATNTGSQGAGNYRDDTLNIGARNNGSALFLTGRIYSLIVRGATSTDAEIANTESFVTKKITPIPEPTFGLGLYSADGIPWVDTSGVAVTDTTAGFSVAQIQSKLSSV